MKPVTWKHAREALRRESAPVSPVPADHFWSDFKARARMYPQPVSAAAAERIPRMWGMRWALATAAILALAGTFLLGPVRPAAAGSGHVIKSIDVVASHGAVLIMTDEARHATILWIADMEDAASGDNS